MYQNKSVEVLREEFSRLVKQIGPLNSEAVQATQLRLDNLTKPQGSLGQLEVIAARLAGIQNTSSPKIMGKAVLVMAGDHGVVAEGVSAFPQEVTAQMVYNIINGGAGINVLARQAGAKVICTDIGVASPLEPETLMEKRVAWGTRNMAKEAAMTEEEALQALLTGAAIAAEAITQGANLLATGEMGIGNTTPSSAIVALLSGRDPQDTVGRGTGINDQALNHKCRVVRQAISINQPDPEDPLDVLCKVGGLEIAALAGAILQAAASKAAIIIDGYISTAAALVAVRMAPHAIDYIFPSHASMEPGHQIALELLGLKPVVSMNLRLGEGTGAALCMPMFESALRILEEMATFADAGVSNKVG